MPFYFYHFTLFVVLMLATTVTGDDGGYGYGSGSDDQSADSAGNSGNDKTGKVGARNGQQQQHQAWQNGQFGNGNGQNWHGNWQNNRQFGGVNWQNGRQFLGQNGNFWRGNGGQFGNGNGQFEGGNWQNGERNGQTGGVNGQFGSGNDQNGGRNAQMGVNGHFESGNDQNNQNGGGIGQFGSGNDQNGQNKGESGQMGGAMDGQIETQQQVIDGQQQYGGDGYGSYGGDYYGGNGQMNYQNVPTKFANQQFRTDQTSVICDRILKSNQTTAIEQLIKVGLLNPIEDYSNRQIMPTADIAKAIKSDGCVPQLSMDSNVCAHALCYHLAFRAIDGVCNNLARPMLGAAFQPYMRYSPAEYSDGISEPAGMGKRSVARDASRFVLAKGTQFFHDQINSLFMQFGQFMAQDMAKSTFQPVDFCSKCVSVAGKCMSVPISKQDNNSLFRQKGCLKMSRSASICGTGDQQQGKPREQFSENTAFVDGSTIYGSNAKDLLKVRDGRTGFLKMSRFNNMMMLPIDTSSCGSGGGGGTCASAAFVSGDSRVNIFIGQSSLYILFVREHNRIARALQSLNGAWSGDRIFQETRKIVGAEIQAFLYNEFVPLLLGHANAKRLIGPYNGYDPNVDPTVASEFTTAAFRFGHATIVDQYARLNENGQSIPTGPFPTNTGTNKAYKLLSEGGIDPVLRGLWTTPIKRPQQLTAAVTEHLFSVTDLGTLNIMRGRDHGIPSYSKMRRICALSTAGTFDELSDQIKDATIRATLSALYASPDDIDLYVGGLIEEPLIGALVGPTFACIIGDQFKRIRDGDRFYYENPGIFSTDQLAELRKTSLSRLLCDNGDHISRVPSKALLLPSGVGTVPCAGLAQIDLRKWAE